MTDPNTPREPADQESLDDVLQGLSADSSDDPQSLDDILASLETESSDAVPDADLINTDDSWGLGEDEAIAASIPADLDPVAASMDAIAHEPLPEISDVSAEELELTSFDLDSSDETDAFASPTSAESAPFEPFLSSAQESETPGDSESAPAPWSAAEPSGAELIEETSTAADEPLEGLFEEPAPMVDEEPVDMPANVEAWAAPIESEPSVSEPSAEAWTAPVDSAEPSIEAQDPFAAPFTPMEPSDQSSIADESSFSEDPATLSPDTLGVPDAAPMDDATPDPWATPSEPAESEPVDPIDPFATMAQPEGVELPAREPTEAVFGADATDADPFSGTEEGLSSDAIASESGAWDAPEVPLEESPLEPVAFSESESSLPDSSAPELPLDLADVPFSSVSEEPTTPEPTEDLPDLEVAGLEVAGLEAAGIDWSDSRESPSLDPSFDQPDVQPDLAGISMSDRSFETPASAEPEQTAPLENLELNESEPDFSGPELPDLPPLAQPSSISQASIDTPSGNSLLEPLDEPLTLSTLLDRSGTRWMVPLGLILIIGVIGVIGFVALQNKSGDDTQQDQNSRLQPSNEWISRLPR